MPNDTSDSTPLGLDPHRVPFPTPKPTPPAGPGDRTRLDAPTLVIGPDALFHDVPGVDEAHELCISDATGRRLVYLRFPTPSAAERFAVAVIATATEHRNRVGRGTGL